MANPLDVAFNAYWNAPTIPLPAGDLMEAIRRTAKRLTRDDDATQDVLLYVLEHLDTFRRKDANSFSKWIYSICRRRRLESYRSRGHELFNDDTFTEDEPSYRDYSTLPDDLRVIAVHLALGASINDLAEATGLKSAALRQKIMRRVKKNNLLTAYRVDGQ